MRAIETEYRGYRFRSRLEARWAVFFDACGYNWKYEAEGYETDVTTYQSEFDGDSDELERMKYLPDFDLGGGLFAEVKGDPDALSIEADRLSKMHDYGGILPSFCDSYNTRRGLLLLGDIPECNGNLVFHKIVQHYKGLMHCWAMFIPKPCFGPPIAVQNHHDSLWDLMDLDVVCSSADDPSSSAWRIEHEQRSVGRHFKTITDAYRSARSARFEHGSSGAIR